MKVSVLTATYNRSEYLQRLFDSLKNNISKEYEIEWLIMDDGSTDNTEQICNSFKNEPGLSVKYFFQSNSGKMNALNNLAKYVTGELWIECDSDDYFVEHAFSKVIKVYKESTDINIYGFCFLKNDQNGQNMGNLFKNKKDTMFDIYFKNGETGEKALVFISEIRRKYKYELEHNEKFVTEARMYHKMDKDYHLICVNECIMICEYQKDGYTQNINKQFIDTPYGYYMYFYEILKDMNTSKILFSKRLYVIKHYILFTYLTNKKLNINIKGFINKLLLVLMYIPGMIKSKKFKKCVKQNRPQ